MVKVPLLGATAHGDYELVKLLLQHGVYINLVNAQGQNAQTYNLAQNPLVHAEIEQILSVAGEFCFTVTCNGQNFVQKYTPTGVTLIPVKQDRPYAKKVHPLSIACANWPYANTWPTLTLALTYLSRCQSCLFLWFYRKCCLITCG